MARQPHHPLYTLSEPERECLPSISRSDHEPAAHVARAKALLAVADGCSFSGAARRAGRRSGTAVGQLVSRCNREGLAALETRHGNCRHARDSHTERQRTLQEFARAPDCEADWRRPGRSPCCGRLYARRGWPPALCVPPRAGPSCTRQAPRGSEIARGAGPGRCSGSGRPGVVRVQEPDHRQKN